MNNVTKKVKIAELLNKEHFEFVKNELVLIRELVNDSDKKKSLKSDPNNYLFKISIKQRLLRLIGYNNSNITKRILGEKGVIEETEEEKRKYPSRMGNLKQVINFLKEEFDVDDK